MRSLVQVRRRIADAGLLVLGTGRPYLLELEKLRSELGLEGSVFFLQDIPHEKLPCYLSRASLFALATRSETFCLAILEAGAAGLPVISTRAPGVTEVIKDGVTGRLVEIGDVAGFARAILHILENASEAAVVADNFRAEIRDHLTWGHHYENYQRIYDRS
jgi:glycosyltransferase involved in cell wall biosynthesis